MKKASDQARTSKATSAKAVTPTDATDTHAIALGSASNEQPSLSALKNNATEFESHSVGSALDGSSDGSSDGNSDGSSRSPRNSANRPAIALPNTNRRHMPNRAPNFAQSYQPVSASSDRIAIFIDGSNLFYAASHLNIEVDYRRLLSTLVRGRRLLRAYFYTGVDPQNEKQRGFLLWLNRHGHRVVSKELVQLPDGSRKANMHVEMAVDMMRISEYCSTLTLLGGDGNLAYALQVLSQRGTSIEVVSLQSMTSDSLIDLADSYTDLADLRDEIKR
ncbi:MAG: NYN domain-containing protein [Phormidesmis sp.]